MERKGDPEQNHDDAGERCGNMGLHINLLSNCTVSFGPKSDNLLVKLEEGQLPGAASTCLKFSGVFETRERF